MSVDAGMMLRLVVPKGPLRVLEALLASRWSARVDGWWCVPLGEDVSEWHMIRGNRTEVDSVFRAKVAASEVVGIRLWWDGHDVGGEFLVFPSCDVSFSPTMNRVRIGDRSTDVSWYASRLIPVFAGHDGIGLESWVWTETG
jgi:hypothetical protein